MKEVKTEVVTLRGDILIGNPDGEGVIFATTVNLNNNKPCTMRKVTICGMSYDMVTLLHVSSRFWAGLILSNAGWDIPAFTFPQQTTVDLYVDEYKPLELNQFIPRNTVLTINFRCNLDAVQVNDIKALGSMVIEYEINN